MGMPIAVNLPGLDKQNKLFSDVFDYFRSIDQRFSPYIKTSEVTQINRTKNTSSASSDMRLILELAEQTKQQTNGYFDVWHDGTFDPSGVVKGWAIQQAANLVIKTGQKDFYIEAGGDLMTGGHNDDGEPWLIGIRNPFNRDQNVKVLQMSGMAVATSGTAIRGQHIYNPHQQGKTLDEIVSLTVVGPSICDADRFATAAFAMGPKGIHFINTLDGFEAYMVDAHGMATMTDHFEKYVSTV
jgi:thiamine biosynthesis lipoprotein